MERPRKQDFTNNLTFRIEGYIVALQKYCDHLEQPLEKEMEEETISLERAKKYARHQHFLGTQQKDLIEFEDWKYNPSS